MNIIGRLTREAEVRNLPNEKQVVNFSIATNDNYRNKQGERLEQTTYFECAYWISPKVADFLLVELSGRAYTSAWLGKDGQPHAGLNFHTSQIRVHGNGKRTENISTESNKTDKKEISNSKSNDSDKDDDLPF
ncbi:MAG: ssb [Chryseobacterium sp.]|jgi:single-strand DNA-binding protein|uniref:single-stranded DNA-binding protein n=1 Tax=Chryseobacterium sp. TaxID=1871047 RepID=UPI00260274E1|nr:single-stranded DNA-binding protein [Chryseobacterium sp.]MDF2552182.1 ssb [Chryseobacterium sp.]